MLCVIVVAAVMTMMLTTMMVMTASMMVLLMVMRIRNQNMCIAIHRLLHRRIRRLDSHFRCCPGEMVYVG